MINKLINNYNFIIIKVKKIFLNNKAEGFFDIAISILISIILGTLLLAGLYALFGDVFLPTLKTRIESLFNYNGW